MKLQSLNPIQKFLNFGSSSGILLFGATILALIWANTPFSDDYHNIWHQKMGIKIGDFELIKPVFLWINDGLMAVFFFLIGMEIKREMLIGELNSLKKASFPLVAAIGRMVLFTLLGLKMRWIELPENMDVKQIVVVAFLAGVGFTMSIFVANLAFDVPIFIDSAKLGILVASIVAGLLGYFFKIYFYQKLND